MSSIKILNHTVQFMRTGNSIPMCVTDGLTRKLDRFMHHVRIIHTSLHNKSDIIGLNDTLSLY